MKRTILILAVMLGSFAMQTQAQNLSKDQVCNFVTSYMQDEYPGINASYYDDVLVIMMPVSLVKDMVNRRGNVYITTEEASKLIRSKDLIDAFADTFARNLGGSRSEYRSYGLYYVQLRFKDTDSKIYSSAIVSF